MIWNRYPDLLPRRCAMGGEARVTGKFRDKFAVVPTHNPLESGPWWLANGLAVEPGKTAINHFRIYISHVLSIFTADGVG